MTIRLQSLEKSKSDNPAVNCSIFGKKRRFPIGSSSGQDKYLAKHNAFFDQLDLVTYEEVCSALQSGAKKILRCVFQFLLFHPLTWMPIQTELHSSRVGTPLTKLGRNFFFTSERAWRRASQ